MCGRIRWNVSLLERFVCEAFRGGTSPGKKLCGDTFLVIYSYRIHTSLPVSALLSWISSPGGETLEKEKAQIFFTLILYPYRSV